MKAKNLTPSVVPTATLVPGGFTLGLDLGDRSHHVCVLAATGQIIGEGAPPNQFFLDVALTLAGEFDENTAWQRVN